MQLAEATQQQVVVVLVLLVATFLEAQQATVAQDYLIQ
jgi:hypothetical protein